MKKIYNAPAARIFNVKPTTIIAASLTVDSSDANAVSADQSLVNEERTSDGGSLWGNEW